VSNLETVQQIYEAFGRGDVPAILERLAPDVAWEDFADSSAQRAGIPSLARRTGPGEVAGFFQLVGAGELQVSDFQVLALIGGEGNKVVAEVEIEATIAATAKTYRDEELHLWTFDDAGQVISFRHYVDTAKHIEAHTP
jgi:ketosteroid isomerase-like protein